MNELFNDTMLVDGGDPGDGKKPKPKVVPVKPLPTTTQPPHPVSKPYDLDAEMKGAYKNVMHFDNKPAIEIAKSAATKMGINPALLFSSAYQEGMNKAILKPDEVSEAYNNAEKKGLDTKNFPVDGFYSYGLDTFGDNYSQLKKYLPAGFEKNFKVYKAKNEKGQPITTAAFKSNEDALVAKAAMMKQTNEQINNYAKQKGITIDPEDLDYFTLAAYNGGFGNAKIMMDEYSKSKDKKAFIEKGETTRKGVHTNIYPRISRKKLVQQLLDTK
jgi:hypothetical protein